MDLEKRFELERELANETVAKVVAEQKAEHTKTRAITALATLPTWGPILVTGFGGLLALVRLF